MCEKNHLVSVIIPVYNGQKTIERCINSVLNQEFQDMELIVVNDGSTDDTAHILKHYEASDSHIVIVMQENAGVSAARNAGIKHATGKWITFVDADDYLEPDCFETIFLNDIEEFDLVFWNYYRVKPSKKEAKVVFQQPLQIYGVEELLPCVFDNKGRQGLSSVYCRLFRNELILENELLFQEGIVSNEDRIFMLDYLLHSERCLGLENCLYNRTLNADSVMHRWHPDAKDEYLLAAKLLQKRLMCNEIWNICQNSFQRWIIQDIVTLYLETYICHLQNTDSKRNRKKELRLFINEDLIAQSLKQIKCNDLPIKSTIKLICVKYGWIRILDKWYQNKKYFEFI